MHNRFSLLNRLFPERYGDPYYGRFLYILGCGRSGNTLLRKLLVESFQVYIPAETYVIPEALSAFNRSNKFSWDVRVRLVLSFFEYHAEFSTMSMKGLRPVYEECLGLSIKERTFGNILEKLFGFIGRSSGFDYALLGDKTPLNIMSIRLIYRSFPLSNFLFISRHPYDVCYSYLQMGRYGEIEDAARRWRDSHNIWLGFSSNAKGKKLMAIRYEDLVQKPEGVMRAVQRWLVVEDRKVAVPDNAFWGDIGAYKHHSMVNSDVSTLSIGKGVRSLSKADKRVIDRIVGDLKAKFSYE